MCFKCVVAAAFLRVGSPLWVGPQQRHTEYTGWAPCHGRGPETPAPPRFTRPTLQHPNQFKSEGRWGPFVALRRRDDQYTLRGLPGPR